MYDRILVAVDGSPTTERALDETIQLTQKLDSGLIIAHVIDNSYLMHDVGYIDVDAFTEALARQGNQIIADAHTRAEKTSVHVRSVVVDGPIGAFDIGTTIEQAAYNIDAQALVLGTHGRHGFQQLFLGSVAESIVRRSTLLMLLIRAEPTETSHAPAEPLSNATVA